MTNEQPQVEIDEETVLEKFEGEPTPENLVERVYIKNGVVVGVEEIQNGTVVSVEGRAF